MVLIFKPLRFSFSGGQQSPYLPVAGRVGSHLLTEALVSVGLVDAGAVGAELPLVGAGAVARPLGTVGAEPTGRTLASAGTE